MQGRSICRKLREEQGGVSDRVYFRGGVTSVGERALLIFGVILLIIRGLSNALAIRRAAQKSADHLRNGLLKKCVNFLSKSQIEFLKIIAEEIKISCDQIAKTVLCCKNRN